MTSLRSKAVITGAVYFAQGGHVRVMQGRTTIEDMDLSGINELPPIYMVGMEMYLLLYCERIGKYFYWREEQ